MKHMLTFLMVSRLGLSVLGAEKPKPLPKDIPALTALAGKGDARAQNELGVLFFFGTGVKKNLVEAVKWFTKSAAQGEAKAQYNLGILCERGAGVLENDTEAVKWFTKAAVQGYSPAQADLGAMYVVGKGVAKFFRRLCVVEHRRLQWQRQGQAGQGATGEADDLRAGRRGPEALPRAAQETPEGGQKIIKSANCLSRARDSSLQAVGLGCRVPRA
jgi:TPR repeat protein